MSTEKEVRDLIEGAGGTVDEVSGPLPDGSGFAEASFPLPKTHWLYAEGHEPPPMPFRLGTEHPLRHQVVEAVRAVVQYAVRAATMNGKDDDYDPDAIVQNAVVGMVGYFTPDGCSGGDSKPTVAIGSVPLVDLTDRLLGGVCQFAGPERGDCERAVGLPGRSIPGQHDGPDDTVDVYGKPNGWCWHCWKSYQIEWLRSQISDPMEVPTDILRLSGQGG